MRRRCSTGPGSELTTGLRTFAGEHGFTLITSGAPALFYLRIADDDSLMLHQEWVAECMRRGVFFSSHHNHFISATPTSTDITRTLEIAHEAFGVVRSHHPELELTA